MLCAVKQAPCNKDGTGGIYTEGFEAEQVEYVARRYPRKLNGKFSSCPKNRKILGLERERERECGISFETKGGLRKMKKTHPKPRY